MRSLAMVVILGLVILAMAEAQYGSCDWSQCRYDRYLAQRRCSSSGTCCDFANGGNNGNNNNNNGGFNNNNNKPGNNGNNNNNNGGFNNNNNNKPGSCPPYNGRRKRSPRGRYPGNNGNGRFPGNNGGQGYNPGYNNGNGYNPGYGNGYNPGYGNNNGGSCIRDSECSADLECCYLRSGYQCTRPNYYG